MWFQNLLSGPGSAAGATSSEMWAQCALARAMVATCTAAGGGRGDDDVADSRLELLRRRGWSTLRAIGPAAGPAE